MGRPVTATGTTGGGGIWRTILVAKGAVVVVAPNGLLSLLSILNKVPNGVFLRVEIGLLRVFKKSHFY